VEAFAFFTAMYVVDRNKTHRRILYTSQSVSADNSVQNRHVAHGCAFGFDNPTDVARYVAKDGRQPPFKDRREVGLDVFLFGILQERLHRLYDVRFGARFGGV
jgi:hypothetical protein